MARKRMIDPAFWTDEKLGECSMQERLLFMGLISNADDEGIGRANPKLLKSLIFPYDDLRTSDLEKWLSRLGGLKLIVLYTVGEQAYYYLPNFNKHQTINKPTVSIFPKPDASLPYDYGSTTVALPPNRIEEKRIEEKGKEEKRNARTRTRKDFTPPTLEEVKAYVKERNNDVDAKRFFDYFETGGWLDSEGKPVLNWKQKLITWEKKRGGARKADLNINSYQGVKLDGIIEVE